MSKATQVLSQLEHIRASVQSSIEVVIRFTDQSVVYATIISHTFNDVTIRVWGQRRLRRIRLDKIKIAEPVIGLSWDEFTAIRDFQSKGIVTKGLHRQKRHVHKSAEST